MVTNFNDTIRNKICNTYIIDYINEFESLEYKEQEIVLKLILMDYYKINCYFYDQKSYLFQYDMDEVIDFCFNNINMVYKLIIYVKTFNQMDYISKCLLIEEMDKLNKDSELLSISKLYLLDKLTYQIIDDLDCYKEYYNNYIDVHSDIPNRRDFASDFISYRVMDLKSIDLIKYKKYILEFIKVYYKWKNFIKEHDGEYLINDEDFIYLDKIKNNDIDSLFKELESNFEFLNTLVSEYLYYKTSKLEIKEEIVDNYLDDKIKNKLKIQEN